MSRTAFQRPSGYYALQTVQTRFRSRGDFINTWQDIVVGCKTRIEALNLVESWRADPVPGFVLAFVGLNQHEDN